MEIYTQAIHEVIKQQQAVMGPLALSQAKKVAGIQVTTTGQITVAGNGRDVLGNLVGQYAKLFGQASIEVCREAVKEIKPPLSHEQLPDILK